jgi:hypothetical protein
MKRVEQALWVTALVVVAAVVLTPLLPSLLAAAVTVTGCVVVLRLSSYFSNRW